MIARLRKFLSDLGETFWVLPALMVVGGILGAVGAVHLDRSHVLPQWLIASPWLYSGGATGARTLLGAVASSTIGVAGTVFSITIAALSLAACSESTEDAAGEAADSAMADTEANVEATGDAVGDAAAEAGDAVDAAGEATDEAATEVEADVQDETETEAAAD